MLFLILDNKYPFACMAVFGSEIGFSIGIEFQREENPQLTVGKIMTTLKVIP